MSGCAHGEGGREAMAQDAVSPWESYSCSSQEDSLLTIPEFLSFCQGLTPLSSWSWEWQLSRADYRPSTRPLVGYHVKFDEKMRPRIRLVTSLKNQEKQSIRESLSFSFYLSPHHCHSLKRKFTQAFCYRMPVCWWHNRSRANIKITRTFFFPNAGLTTWVSFLVIIYLL